MLKFPDGTKIRVNGLSEILAELYAEGRQPNNETAEDMTRLEAKKNFIPSSDLTRKEYSYVLLIEHRRYLAGRKDRTP